MTSSGSASSVCGKSMAMDKFDVMIETYGLQYFLDFYDIEHSQVLRELYDGGYIDPEDFEYDEMEVEDYE